MSEGPQSFLCLLECAQQGDEDALAHLMDCYEGVIRRAARGMLGPLLQSHLDSLDLVQSVHRTILGGLQKKRFTFSCPEQLIALALTLVRRKVARHWRKCKQEPPQSNLSQMERMNSPAANSLSTEWDPAEMAQFNDSIQHLLNHLDDKVDRQLLSLRLQGLSTADVARQLGLDSGFLRVRLGRLRQRLQEKGLLTEWI